MPRARAWIVLLAASIAGCPSAPDALRDASAPDAIARCAVDLDCDDGRFCNGPEECTPSATLADARGCVTGIAPCAAPATCNEVDGQCDDICTLDPDGDGDGVPTRTCGGADCDDADATSSPLLVEICDEAGHDKDCNPLTFGFRDADGDGEADAACCNTDPRTGLRHCGTDCADERRDVRSGLAESCDAIDNDCDMLVDEGVTRTGAADMDFDLHGATAMTIEGCAGEPGFSPVTDDCDDTSAGSFGAQLEICDGVDNNCNGESDEVMGLVTWYADEDGDGFGGGDPGGVVVSCAVVPGHVTRPGDCDDTLSDVHPGARERCNAVDDDCNGRTDYRVSPGNTEDDDGDGAADRRCGGDDCDDANAAVGPHAPELMNGIDDDCNGVVDDSPTAVSWWIDRDLDGYGDASTTPTSSETPIAERVTRGGDCDDGDVYVHPGAADGCDGLDDDCDGTLDESAPLLAFFADLDADGWAADDLASLVLGCRAPALAASRVGDCVDSDATRHPGALELCNAIDDDCDTSIDEESTRLWYVDGDGDGAGAGAGVESCMPLLGHATASGDCDDADARRFPGQLEACNAVDDDCDGTIDDGATASCTAPHTMTAMCTAGACTLSCAPGYSECDGDRTTGCETSTARSPTSCGTCFHACSVADSCGVTTAGTCDVAPMAQLWASDRSFFASRSTGGVAAWGDGAEGRLSIPFPDRQPTPILAAFRDVSRVAAFDGGGCAIAVSGQMSCWGTSFHGTSSVPVTVALPGPAVAIAASRGHACAVLADRSLYCWGSNGYGELSDGTIVNSAVPRRAVDTAGPITDAIDVACSYYNTCVLRERSVDDRYVSCSGWNREAGLGNGSVDSAPHTAAVDVMGLPPDLVALSRGTNYGSTCVRDVAGRVYCWGDNTGSTLGLGPLGPTVQTIPITPPGLERGILEIAFVPWPNAYGGCAIRAGAGGAREALCWGTAGGYPIGWSGDGTAGPEVSLTSPTLLGPAGSPITDALAVARGNRTACVLRVSGEIWCAGDDTYGELGDGPSDGSGATFVRVVGLP